MQREGITLGRKRIDTDRVPTRARPLVTHDSPSFAVLVRGLGKYSNNYVAEMVLKTIGAETKAGEARATWEHGLSAVREYLESTVKLEPGSYRYENGSGLFDSNEFTPRQMVKVLSAAHRDYRYGPDFVASLSIAGVDGTLSKRMDEGPAARQVRAKTGTLATVSALAGYAAIDGRAPLAFAVFVNDFPKGDARTARAAQDDVAEALVTFLENAE
jgi:D-alanyl-D-alanine carboxypeptidase/D-alanyl-D-alanine-endopeptidase (penicillin-binding protein 4)